MPLVVPGLTDNKSGDKTQEWAQRYLGNTRVASRKEQSLTPDIQTNKLVGKKLSDEAHTETTFCKKDLPEKCRVIEPGMMVTKDFVPERLNVHVNADGTVSHVQHG